MLSDSLRASLITATLLYEQSLDQAASYLAARGIDRDAATGHHLGFVAEPHPGHERFRGMLSIPYVTPAGPVAIKFRRIQGEDGPKYDGPSQKARLYNARVCADGGDVVAICEGELDALVCSSVVGVPAVGSPGTTWLEHWSRCFGDFDRVVVIADHDAKEDGSDPGLKHAKKVAGLVHGELVLPPGGMDLGEWVQQDGPEAVRKAMGL